jgi:hypothetical protein
MNTVFKNYSISWPLLYLLTVSGYDFPHGCVITVFTIEYWHILLSLRIKAGHETSTDGFYFA